MRKFFLSLFEIFEVALIAVGAVVLIRSFLLQPFLVSGSSMVPNFSNGDYLLIDELTYRVREPERGEVVVFRFPKEESVFFIKRVIGLPGEKVIIKDGAITIVSGKNSEGFLLQEKYLQEGFRSAGSLEIPLGPREYFVLGDNRSFSYDSRSWGALAREDMVGLVRVRLWPLRTAQAFVAPEY